MKRLSLLVIFLLSLVVSVVGVAAQAEPVVAQQPESTTTLRLWIPDEWIEADNAPARELLEDLLADFAGQTGITLVPRWRRVGDVGGIMSTLRSASAVAPGSLPHLTLLRRQDLVLAERSGLVRSLEGLVPTTIVQSLGNALMLGQIRGDLYGLPYTLDVLQRVAWPRPGTLEPGLTFEEVLARGQIIAFPAARSTGLSDVFYAQYLASGGELDEAGQLRFNPDALVTVLTYYQALAEADLLPANLMSFSISGDYRQAFVRGEIDQAVFTSSTALRLLETEPDLLSLALPVPDAALLTTVLNGWNWVIVTGTPDEQGASMRFVEWMMNADRQAEVARVTRVLPSQPAALVPSLPPGLDAGLYRTLIESATLPLVDSENSIIARALQTSFVAVINGDRTAAQATADVATQLDN